ncbi:MAG: DUF4275 family protein [Clostridia bacterium]|nr:DUF4275 family protein [Clostridia bacterium]
MKTVKCGKFEIAIDTEQTNKYYHEFNPNNNQANRNFREYCKNLGPEEIEFFSSLGIIPECCNVEPFWIENGILLVSGFYLICGEFIEVSDETPETHIERMLNPMFYVGDFSFCFLGDKLLSNLYPYDIPAGFICLRFTANTKWMLNEKPLYDYGHYITETRKKIAENTNRTKEKYKALFSDIGAQYRELRADEIDAYRSSWISQYASENEAIDELELLCNVRLWHIFSFDRVTGYSEHDAADSAFDDINKESCVFMTNDLNVYAFELKNAHKLTSSALRGIDKYSDYTVTAFDFSWTYSKTHEEEMQIGPYFYKKY